MPGAGYRTVALTVSTAIFMQFLDSTALNTAIPTIAAALKTDAVDLNLAILAYQLAMTVLIPVGGALADRVGQRNAFALSLIVFALGSALCALSSTLPWLVAARALQGAGGAIMIPVSRTLVIRSSTKGELLSAMNWLLVPGMIGPMLGPFAGGLIVTYASWRWIFLINIPIALAGVVTTLLLIPDLRESSRRPFDAKGTVLVGAAVFGILFGLDSAAQPNAGWITSGLLSGGVLLAWLFLRHARRTAAPVLDLSLLDIASFRHSISIGASLRTIASASSFILPLWLQLGMGKSAATSGAVLILPTLGVMLSRLVGVPLTRLIHPRTVAIAGAAVMVITLLVSACFNGNWSLLAIGSTLVVQSIALSVSMMVINASTYIDVESEQTGRATAIYTTAQQLTLSFGITVGVWAIGGARWFYRTGEHDNRLYSFGMLVLTAFGVLGFLATRKLDEDAMGALRPRPVS
jgi:EmrB/QacA subfamily drug resistance transporter